MSGQMRPPMNRHERRSQKHRTKVHHPQGVPMNQPPQQQIQLNAEVIVKFRKEFHEELGEEGRLYRMAAVGNDGDLIRIIQTDKMVLHPKATVLFVEVIPSKIATPPPIEIVKA